MWQVKLCDPSLTRAVPQRFRDEYHTHYKALHEFPDYLLIYYGTVNVVIGKGLG